MPAPKPQRGLFAGLLALVLLASAAVAVPAGGSGGTPPAPVPTAAAAAPAGDADPGRRFDDDGRRTSVRADGDGDARRLGRDGRDR